MKVPFNDLKRIHDPLRNEFHQALDTILDSSGFVGDTMFAKNFKEYTKSPYCITCNSGTDALYLAIKALELEDNSKIMVPAVSYAATAMAVVNAGHVPVFVDVNPKTGLIDFIDTKIDDDIKCIIIVHLFGQCAHVPRDVEIPIIEDCAQAHGTFLSGRAFGPKTPQENFALLAAIIEGKNGSIFIKMTGPKETVESQLSVLKKMVLDSLDK